MGWLETYPHSVFASVILVDNKIMLWKVGEYTLHSGYRIDLSKCSYEEKEFVVNNDDEHNDVFEKLSKDWFRQWKMHEKHQGGTPFDDEPKIGDTINIGGHQLEIVSTLKKGS